MACRRSVVSKCSRPKARPRADDPLSYRGIAEVIAAERAKTPTERMGGPAVAITSSPIPNSLRSESVPAEMNSPQTFLRGNCVFSMIATRQPARARRNAAVAPAGPAPMIMTSRSITGATLARGVGEPLGRKAVAERSGGLLMQIPAAGWPQSGPPRSLRIGADVRGRAGDGRSAAD